MCGLRPESVATALAFGAALAVLSPHALAAPDPIRIFGMPTAGHGPDCLCRAPNAIARVGQSVCLGGRVAECVMVLNNTSWKFTEAPCPVSMLTPVPER